MTQRKTGREYLPMLTSKSKSVGELEFSINPIVLITVIFPILGLSIIAIQNYGNPEYPTLSLECVKYLGALFAGTLGYIFSSWAMHDGQFVISWKWGRNDGSIFILTIVVILGIQLSVAATAFFQVTALDVYFFYVSAAPAEEMLYRGGILFFILVFLTKMDKREEMPYFIKSIIAILVSSLLFALAHQDYYDNMPVLIGTLACGVMFGVAFCASKGNLLITIVIHALFNFGAAGNIVQTLNNSGHLQTIINTIEFVIQAI